MVNSVSQTMFHLGSCHFLKWISYAINLGYSENGMHISVFFDLLDKYGKMKRNEVLKGIGSFYRDITWQDVIVGCRSCFEDHVLMALQLRYVKLVGVDRFSRLFAQQTHCFSSQGKHWSVSSFGRCRTSTGRITTGSLCTSGYRQVQIYHNSFLVHRVVAHAFLGLPQNEEAWQVHHRDGNKSNNRMNNLEYVTPAMNLKHSYKLNPGRGNGADSRSRPVMWRPEGGQMWKTFPSITSAARNLGISTAAVSRCCCRGTGGVGEFKFAEAPAYPPLHGEKWVQLMDVTGIEIPSRQVSSFGRLKSSGGHISQGCRHPTGYFVTGISRGKDVKRAVLVHQLVAYSFLGPPPTPAHTQINHKDLDRSNNRVDNLEYVTPAQNAAHSRSIGNRRQWRKPVLGRLIKTEDQWTWYPSMTDAANVLGVHVGSVWLCTRGLQRQTAGYEFRLASEETITEDFPGEEWREVDLQGLLAEKERLKRYRKL